MECQIMWHFNHIASLIQGAVCIKFFFKDAYTSAHWEVLKFYPITPKIIGPSLCVKFSLSLPSYTHPLGSKQVMVQRPESLPGVVTPICPAHEVFNNQSNVDEADAIVRRQVSLRKRDKKNDTVNNPCQVINSGG